MEKRLLAHLRLVLLFVVGMGLATCGSPTAAPPTAMPLPAPTGTPPPANALRPEDLEAFDFVIARKLEAVPLAGIALAIRWGQNPAYVQGYGYADLENEVPVEPTTVFRIASLTKQFTAAAIMQLVEQGQLSVDDPVQEFYPDAPASWSGITIYHLLTHTSGIPHPEDLPPAMIEPGMHHPNTAEELVAALHDVSLAFEPGSQFQYGNAGYGLLSGVVEQVSGLAIEDYFQQRFFEPLGLDSTLNCLRRFEGIAQGYRIAGRDLVPVVSYNPSRLLGATGLCSTAGDLVKWQQALAEGRVVDPESYLQMTTPTHLNDGTTVPYGYGLALDAQAVLHGGGTAGFRSLLVYFSDDDLTIVLLSNTDVPASYSLEALADVIATRILGAPEG